MQTKIGMLLFQKRYFSGKRPLIYNLSLNLDVYSRHFEELQVSKSDSSFA